MVGDMIEFYGEKNCYQLVRDFHIAFGHPYHDIDEHDGKLRRLSMRSRVHRAKWMAEEVMEYVGAGDTQQIDQVDALVDLLYFVLGTFVMIGLDPYGDERLLDMAAYGAELATKLHEEGTGIPPADRLYTGSLMEWRAADAEGVIETIFNFVLQPETPGQIQMLGSIMDWVLVQAAIVGADPHPYFIIVHDKNMSKLWPDGKPRYSNDGKIIKPEIFVDARKEMVNLMLNHLDKETEDDPIPF